MEALYVGAGFGLAFLGFSFMIHGNPFIQITINNKEK